MEKNLAPGSMEMGTGNEFYRLFMQAPVAVCILRGPDYKVEMANDSMLQFLGRTTDVIGKPVESSMTEARKQGLIALLDTVRQTNQPLYVYVVPKEKPFEACDLKGFVDCVARRGIELPPFGVVSPTTSPGSQVS